MNLKHLKLVLLIYLGVFLISCAAYKPTVINPDFRPIDLNSRVQAGLLKPKVDNFYVIMDASGSQDETYRGYTKFAIAQDFLSRFNQTIPDVPFTAALRGFGHSRYPFVQKTKLYYGPTAYTKAGFEAAVARIDWGGASSPADLALDSATADLIPLSGRTAVILVGDGQYQGYDPVSAAKRMKAQYGDNVCIYTVLVGSEDPASIKCMQDIAAASGCGFYQSAKYLESPQAMASWVEAVLFKKTAPKATVPNLALQSIRCILLEQQARLNRVDVQPKGRIVPIPQSRAFEHRYVGQQNKISVDIDDCLYDDFRRPVRVSSEPAESVVCSFQILFSGRNWRPPRA